MNDEVGVGVDADVRGDLHRLPRDGLRVNSLSISIKKNDKIVKLLYKKGEFQ